MAGLETIEYDKGLWVKHEYEAHEIHVSSFSHIPILGLQPFPGDWIEQKRRRPCWKTWQKKTTTVTGGPFVQFTLLGMVANQEFYNTRIHAQLD